MLNKFITRSFSSSLFNKEGMGVILKNCNEIIKSPQPPLTRGSYKEQNGND